MGLFDFFDRFDMSNPEAQIVNSPLLNTAYNKPKETAKPIQYGALGSAMAGSVMNKLGMKKDPGPLPTVTPSQMGSDPLTGGKTYGPSKQEILQKGVSNYVPKDYKGLEKSGQVWGNVGLDAKQKPLPLLDGLVNGIEGRNMTPQAPGAATVPDMRNKDLEYGSVQ